MTEVNRKQPFLKQACNRFINLVSRENENPARSKNSLKIKDSFTTESRNKNLEDFQNLTGGKPQSSSSQSDAKELFYDGEEQNCLVEPKLVSEEPNSTPVNAPELVEATPEHYTDESNTKFFLDWALGRGDRERTYLDGSRESTDMKNSPGGKVLREQYYTGGCKDLIEKGRYDTCRAYYETIASPETADWSSTSLQVGGFGGASVTNNPNDTVTFQIPNEAGVYSFFLHYFQNRENGLGQTIEQTIIWTEEKNKTKCPPEK